MEKKMEKINELDFYKLIFEKYKEKENFFVIAYYQDVEKIKRIFHYEKIIYLRNFEKILLEIEYIKNNIETFYGTTLLYENLLDKNLDDEILFLDFCNKKGANIIFLVNKPFSEKFKKFHDYFFINEHIIFSDKKIFETFFREENKNKLKFYSSNDSIGKILNPFPLVLENKGSFLKKIKNFKIKLSENYVFRNGYSIDNKKINLPIFKSILLSENDSFFKQFQHVFKKAHIETIFDNYFLQFSDKNFNTIFINNFNRFFPKDFSSCFLSQEIDSFQEFNKLFEFNFNYDQWFKIYNAFLNAKKEIERKFNFSVNVGALFFYFEKFFKKIIDQNYIDHFNFIIIEDFKNDNIEFSFFDILLSNLGFDYMIFENPVLKLELAKLKNLKNDFNFF